MADLEEIAKLSEIDPELVEVGSVSMDVSV